MKTNKSENQLGFLNITGFILTIYVLTILLIDSFYKFPEEIAKILFYFDNLICFFFFIEFLYRFFNSENKLSFMKWGWIDLLSCIPMIDFLRAGRILRLIRLIRIIKAFKTTKNLLNHIFSNKIKGTLTSLIIITFLLIIFSAIAILQLENVQGANIKTAEDAIWWVYTTLTTIGYGDKYPITTEGRILAMFLMTFGVGIFGTFTAYISTIFIKEVK
jgi:voltage-gated potassium channel